MRNNDDLTGYPRPNVAVDLAVLTVAPDRSPDPARPDGQLVVLVQDRETGPAGPALPGRFLRERQHIPGAVADVLRLKVGLKVPVPAPHLLRVFDDPDRDPRAWTISLGHALVLPHEVLRMGRGRLVGVDLTGALVSDDPLLFDHGTIVREAAAAMRDRYEHLPDPDGLLGTEFTLAELRACHEAVLGERLLKDTFNRRMSEHLEPVLERGSTLTRSAGGRPARVFTKSGDADHRATSRRRLQLPRESV
ncbi:NrtR DNA-binding winged helix domain-containing protein [Georgenia muralis]|uniref:NrtR DNA-binding winged helix domain-containing protein n=1 Tax=Georgenia muralis TaxID=154117 RepID=A0A3N5A6L9_9MICO|nr:NUDIX hydrolase [Georgenia muralis]RPF29045.1 hypothetical protein EDD32_3600 [Georgenia muralis]